MMGAVLGGAAARTGATAMATWAGLATLQSEPPSSVLCVHHCALAVDL